MIQARKVSKILGLIASSILLLIGILHGSGIDFINNLVQSSNVSAIVKRIFPVLYILPSIQLIGFAVFGIIATYMIKQANKIFIALSILILMDSLLAFYLHAIAAGLILIIPACLFIYLAYRDHEINQL